MARHAAGTGSLSELPITPASRTREGRSPVRIALLAGVTVVVVLGSLFVWLTYRSTQSTRDADRRAEFLEAGRTGALDLTTIDWREADRDVARIMDNATGDFRDDFAQRSQPFVDLITRSKSTTVGTVTAAGIESESGNTAQVLVSVTVKTSNEAAPQQEPRSWRMRIGVQRSGDDLKVSNVEFVP